MRASFRIFYVVTSMITLSLIGPAGCANTASPDHALSTPAIANAPSITIAPEQQQLIGLTTALAIKKPAVKIIRALGRVAFDPELALAQREFLSIIRNEPGLRAAARSRLQLLGMGNAEIDALEKRKSSPSNLYLPQIGESVRVYATLYQDEMNLVPIGSTAAITLPSASGRIFSGTVKSIDPVVDAMTRSVRAHIEVPSAVGLLRPDSYVNVELKIDLGEALTIPASAVIATGTRTVAYVVQEGKNFIARAVATGPRVGDDIVITDGMTEGETVITNSLFLVDSESQLQLHRAAEAASPTTPSCPAGEAWDTSMAMCMPKVGS